MKPCMHREIDGERLREIGKDFSLQVRKKEEVKEYIKTFLEISKKESP